MGACHTHTHTHGQTGVKQHTDTQQKEQHHPRSGLTASPSLAVRLTGKCAAYAALASHGYGVRGCRMGVRMH